MVVQFYNLGFTLAHAENAQAMQNTLYAQERGANQFIAGQVQDQSKQQAETQVQTTEQIENEEIAGNGRGAHSFLMTKEEKEKEEQETQEQAALDPMGRGQSLDCLA